MIQAGNMIKDMEPIGSITVQKLPNGFTNIKDWAYEQLKS